jgi:hypothetical protein
MARRNANLSGIPADILAAATAEQAEANRRREEIRERASRDALCLEAAQTFLRVTQAVPPATPDIPAVCAALLATCQAFQAAGRLADWSRVDHDKTFAGFREQGGRALSRAGYDWAKRLFDAGCVDELTEDSLADTWNEQSLRDAFRWLRVFIAGLSGEGAVLPGLGHPPALAVPLPETAMTPPSAPAERMTFDERTMIITIDGRPCPMEDGKSFVFVRFLYETGKPGQSVKNDTIKKNIAGLEGHNAIPRFIRMLPQAIQNIIFQDRSDGGRYIVLSPLEKIVPR